MPRTFRKWFGALTALVIVLSLTATAEAHKVYLFAWVEGDQVKVEAYFSKSKKVINGLIQVFDPSGKMLTEGRTNDQGEWSFKPTVKADLKLVLSAGQGHQTEWVVKADELPAGLPQPGSGQAPAPAPEEQAAQSSASSEVKADPAELKRVVEQALDEKLKPINRALAELREGDAEPKLRDIISGLGWIVGIMGLVMYFRSKQKG